MNDEAVIAAFVEAVREGRLSVERVNGELNIQSVPPTTIPNADGEPVDVRALGDYRPLPTSGDSQTEINSTKA